jgi:elongation factor P
MKIAAIDIRPGTVLDEENKLWLVTKIGIMQPGKGAAVNQVEMKEIKTGTKKNVRYRTQEVVEKVQLEEHEMQYLYNEGENAVFMNQENFEQVMIPLEMIGEPARFFLHDGMICSVLFHETTALTVELPTSVTLTITEADPYLKGQTVTSSYKPATLENGVKIQVPPHITAGDKVVVKTADGAYVERAK